MRSAAPLQRAIYFGPFVHSKILQELDLCENGVIGVDEKGKIAFVERDASSAGSQLSKPGWDSAKVVQVPGNGFLFPGFIG